MARRFILNKPYPTLNNPANLLYRTSSFRITRKKNNIFIKQNQIPISNFWGFLFIDVVFFITKRKGQPHNVLPSTLTVCLCLSLIVPLKSGNNLPIRIGNEFGGFLDSVFIWSLLGKR
ncbi:unnamed protein product [Ilex paraguariensis]|uniref:Uncharacterized protein n=1 Tax=Ilex paraguariensis TaxID=185542 RepID=A0ABC8SR98_9AQUA